MRIWPGPMLAAAMQTVQEIEARDMLHQKLPRNGKQAYGWQGLASPEP